MSQIDLNRFRKILFNNKNHRNKRIASNALIQLVLCNITNYKCEIIRIDMLARLKSRNIVIHNSRDAMEI